MSFLTQLIISNNKTRKEEHVIGEQFCKEGLSKVEVAREQAHLRRDDPGGHPDAKRAWWLDTPGDLEMLVSSLPRGRPKELHAQDEAIGARR